MNNNNFLNTMSKKSQAPPTIFKIRKKCNKLTTIIKIHKEIIIITIINYHLKILILKWSRNNKVFKDNPKTNFYLIITHNICKLNILTIIIQILMINNNSQGSNYNVNKFNKINKDVNPANLNKICNFNRINSTIIKIKIFRNRLKLELKILIMILLVCMK